MLLAAAQNEEYFPALISWIVSWMYSSQVGSFEYLSLCRMVCCLAAGILQSSNSTSLCHFRTAFGRYSTYQSNSDPQQAWQWPNSHFSWHSRIFSYKIAKEHLYTLLDSDCVIWIRLKEKWVRKSRCPKVGGCPIGGSGTVVLQLWDLGLIPTRSTVPTPEPCCHSCALVCVHCSVVSPLI